MKINITRKNVIIAAAGFLAGVIITTSGFLIFRGCTQKQHKQTPPTSFSQSQIFGEKGVSGENGPAAPEADFSQNGQYKNSKNGGNKSENNTPVKPEENAGATEKSNNS